MIADNTLAPAGSKKHQVITHNNTYLATKTPQIPLFYTIKAIEEGVFDAETIRRLTHWQRTFIISLVLAHPLSI